MGAIGGEELLNWEKMQHPPAGGERILVTVRLRPLNEREICRNDVSDWECIDDHTIMFRNSVPERSMFPAAYTFDRVFRRDCSTKQVYEEAAKHVALSVVSGINSSIFAYGQTSSGKTFTMSGITEYSVADIYDYVQRHEERAFVLKFSAMEIYNEAVRDLLSADGTQLRLLDDPERGTIVEKLTEETLRDWNHLQELLSICEAQRQIGETSLNEASSRSHQIIRLTIESSAREFLGKDNSSTLAASVHFVDLAGSERASQALSAGTRLKEGCHINRSLLTLGTVIRKLSKGRSAHIPYRDSKLTRILQASLGGNARTAIICTMSPARSHIEQSRNTLLFASCAKQVTTNAQVNVVMSDKALVKHLQKELARLESEIRSPGIISSSSRYEVLVREKDVQIQKMEKEIKELTQQRDLAQSRLEDLLRVVGDDETSKIWGEFSEPSTFHFPSTLGDEVSLSGSSEIADLSPYFGFRKFKMSQYTKENGNTDSNEDYRSSLGKTEDHASSRSAIDSNRFVELGQQQSEEEISLFTGEDYNLEELCKDVRCIEVEESSHHRDEEPNVSLPEENQGPVALMVPNDAYKTKDLELGHTMKGDEQLALVTESTYRSDEQSHQDVRKTINNLVKPYLAEPSPWPHSHLTRSRSCRATLMINSSSPWFEESYQNESTPSSGFEKYLPANPRTFQRIPCSLNYRPETEILSREDSHSSERSASTDVLKAQTMKVGSEDNITSIQSFVAGLKEMAKLQYEKQLIDGQETEPKVNGTGGEKILKDVGVDPMHNPVESPSRWPMEFEKLQQEIIDLWDACNVSLVHRTYFFLLFKGDTTDFIYMEVELRRLSFLKATFSKGSLAKSDGHVITPTSSMRVLRREREMLSRQMQKRLTPEERESLYQQWGIGLDTKQRRLQLARRLWTDTSNMDHIRESASLVAKLVGLLQPGEALKEMFGLSFIPRRSRRKSFSWKNSMSSLL